MNLNLLEMQNLSMDIEKLGNLFLVCENDMIEVHLKLTCLNDSLLILVLIFQ